MYINRCLVIRQALPMWPRGFQAPPPVVDNGFLVPLPFIGPERVLVPLHRMAGGCIGSVTDC